MKNIFLAAALLFSAVGFSQYNSQWQQIDSLEAQGRIKAAAGVVSNIFKTAQKKKDYEQLIKAKIFKYKYYQVNHEDSDQYILKNLNQTLAKLPVPYKNVLESYKGKFLLQYFNQHRWKIRERKEIDNTDPADLATWAEATLQDSIRNSYENSLQNSRVLIETPVEKFSELLIEAPFNRKYKPTLYDLLAHEALDYFKDSSNFPKISPADKYDFDASELYGSPEQFIALKFPQEAQNSSEVAVLNTFQQLEQLHLQDKDPTAFVYAQLQRLEYVNSNFRRENKWENYLQALNRLSEKYENTSATSLLLYTRANYFFERAGETDENGKLLHPDFNKKAVELAERVVKEYPDTEMEQRAFSLLSAVKSVDLDVNIPEYLLPKSAGRMLVSYKSIDSVQLKIFKVPAIRARENSFFKKEETDKFLESNRATFSKTLLLPKAEDYNFHSTEFILPALDTGTYLIYISGENSFGREGYSYGFMTVTNLSLSQTSFDQVNLYRSLNRTTGLPEKDVKLNWKYKGYSFRKKSTDAKGEAVVEKTRNYRDVDYLMASKGEDTLISQFYEGYYRSSDNPESTLEVTAKLYLDRAIYRPGQKVYFKGVLLSHKNGKTSVVPNEFVEVYVEDANYDEVKNFRLQTNKYGSFNGEFLLPKGGLTGSFNIYVEEDLESESVFWAEVEEEDAYRMEELHFSVEEYKRPTFEVKLDSIKRSFSFGDTITLTGNAKAYMGAPISNARVIYTVKQRKMVYRWWYFDGGEYSTVKIDTLKTDDKGNFMLKFPAEMAPEDSEDKDLIYEYSIEATVTDISGETRENSSILKIGKKNLLLKLEMPESIHRRDTLEPRILATNLNDNPVPVSGNFKIYKLRGPDRMLRERLWPTPEIQTIPEDEFKNLFPEEPYEVIPAPIDWPLGELVFEATFETDNRYEPEIPVPANWETGKYIAIVEATSDGSTATGKKVFDINDPKDPSLPDNQRFAASLQEKDLENEKIIRLLLQSNYENLQVHVAVYDQYKTLFSEYVDVRGSRLLEIPVKESFSDQLQVQISGVKNNSALNQTLYVSLPKTVDFLSITTQTFRSKLQPGTEETWSFQIKNNTRKNIDGEVLASMYDMSLDQFTIQSWNTNSEFQTSYSSFPSYRIWNMNGSSSLYNRFPSPWYNRHQARNFDRLQLFDFIMSNPGSFRYRSSRENSNITGNLVGNTRGKVTDEQGQPIPGVNVIIEGTSTGTTTNFDGEFALDTKKGDQLSFSYLGYETKEMLINDQREIFVSLSEDSASLDEVVVVGYGVALAAEEVMEENERVAFLQGKVAGVQVTSSNTVQIRGASSIEEGGMLYVVDGKVVTDYEMASDDVLSVRILKSEEAVALYGSQAAKGAVIINTKKGLQDLQNVAARKDLDETAFFFPSLQIGKNGRVEFSFTSPEALTQWKLRLLAHTRDWITGSYENTVRTQKELSVVPNPPRFLRENDTIIFKSKVSNLSSEAMTGTAMLELFDALTMEPIDDILGNSNNLKNFSVAEDGSTVVAWELIVPEGVQAVTYRVLAKAGDFSDGEENFLPVLTNRMLVKESLPFFVRAGETEKYIFENLAENDSPSLEHHKYTLEYSSNPAWYAIQSLPYLMEFEHECSEQIFARLYANAVGGKILASNPHIKEVFKAWKKDSSLVSDLEKNEELRDLILAETPWVRDAASETAQKQLLAQLFDQEKLQLEQQENLQKLKQMQLSSGAWPWFPGGRESGFITRHIVAGMGHLEKLDIDIKESKMLKNAVAFIDGEALYQQRESINKEDFYKSGYLLHYLYARTFHLEEFPPSAEIKSLIEKSVEANKKDWLKKDLYNKGLLMLTLIRTGETEFAKKIGLSLQETAVKSEDYGMYWKENVASWYWYRAPVETQALLIEAFTELEEPETVDELKIWLLQNKRTNHWPTTKATTEASYALLMQGNDWLQTQDQTMLRIGGEPLPEEKLAETKAEAGTGYRKIVWKAEEITEDFSEISVENNNSTAGYGGAYWQYFEDLDKIKDHGTSPLNVEKELYLNIAGNNGTTLKQITPETVLELGDLVTVRLVVRSTADMDFIHLKDMRASGFEPVNVLSEYKYQDGTGYYESTRDAATHFFFDELRKGIYVLEYTVRANNAGKFSNGITSIESMYAPEFSGHTKGIRVKIK